MYKVVEPEDGVLVALSDEYGGRANIVKDDHCLVLYVDVGNGFKPATHWFREAVEAIPEEWLAVEPLIGNVDPTTVIFASLGEE